MAEPEFRRRRQRRRLPSPVDPADPAGTDPSAVGPASPTESMESGTAEPAPSIERATREPATGPAVPPAAGPVAPRPARRPAASPGSPTAAAPTRPAPSATPAPAPPGPAASTTGPAALARAPVAGGRRRTVRTQPRQDPRTGTARTTASDRTGPAANQPGGAQASTAPVQDPEPTAPAGGTAQPRPPAEERESERGLRGLVGSGSSQVGPGAALRARDAARPTDDDLAAAERDLVIIRRNWVPRESLPGRS